MGTNKKQTVKLSGTLKSFVNAGKKETRVLGSVERYLLSRPSDTSRRSDVLHPSSMAKSPWCHRAAYFSLFGVEVEPQYKRGIKSLLTFEEGHRIHARWQTWFKDMGVLWGKWYCYACKESFTGLSTNHDPAHSTELKYREVPMYIEEYQIGGQADGVLIGFKDPLLLEIKSVGEGTFRWEDPFYFEEHGNDFKKAWEHLQSPFQTHIQQAQIYMKVLELSGVEHAPNEALFIYEAKPHQEVKEFVIRKSDFSVSQLFEEAKLIKNCFDNQTPPPCNVGGSRFCKQCEGL